jgi:DNA-binding NarL/FixJ family response regulator
VALAEVRASPSPAEPEPAEPGAPLTGEADPAPANPAAVPAAEVAAAPPEPEIEVLSERERQVAVLLLDGLTYRQIGERLYITAKTVEHHVGRMRQRPDSHDRSTLFHDLRQALPRRMRH